MRHLNLRAAQRGLTLIELMVGLAIGAILMMTAAPYFGDYTTNSRLRESGNLLFSEALIAQSEAIKRSGLVQLKTTSSGVQVIDVTDAADPQVIRERPFTGGTAAASAELTFGGHGRLMPFPSTGAINMSMSNVTCSADLRCPGLRIDAGGAIRLCGNHQSGCD